jgi:hypothetical protein
MSSVVRQVVDGLRIALRLPRHAVCAQERRDLRDERPIDEAHAAAVEAGVADHLQLLVERPFVPVRTPPFHGPHRLVDQQLLHGAVLGGKTIGRTIGAPPRDGAGALRRTSR